MIQPLLSSRSGRPHALIAAEDIAHVARWQFGAVGPDSGEPEAGISDPQALREAHAQGHAEGFEAGRAAALAEAQAEFAAFRANEGMEIAGRLDALLRAAEAGLVEAEQQIARGTLEIACALARQVLRREMAIDPKALPIPPRPPHQRKPAADFPANLFPWRRDN